MADYGLDPSLVGYLQGNGMPASTTPPPTAPDPYGLPPQVLSGVQNGFQPQQVSASEYALTPPSNQLRPPPPPPPPPPQQHIGVYGGTGVDEVSSAPDTGPASVTAPPQAVAVPAPQADYVAGSATPLDPGKAGTPLKQVAASNQQYAKQQAAQATYAASPDGLNQKADAESRAAIDKERQAATDASAAEMAQNDATAAALKASEDRQAEQAKIDQAKLAQDQANTAKYTAQYAQQVQDAANYKVDTNRSVGLGGLIAVALSGIGDALDHRHGPNTALQILNEGIDKRINDEWAKKKSLGDKASGTKDVLDVYRKGADDDRQAIEFQRAAESKRMADEIRKIGAQYANPAAQARAEQVAAGLDQKAAGITQNEAIRKTQAIKDAQDQANKRTELGIAGGHLALANKQFKFEQDKDTRDFGEKQREYDNSLAEKILTAKAAGKDAEAKQLESVRKYAIRDPSTGNVILNEAGEAQMKQADQLEMAARGKSEAEAQALRVQAKGLRDRAERENHIEHEKAPEVQDALNAAQNVLDTTAKMKELLARDPGMTDRAAWATFGTQLSNAKINSIEFFKAKPSSREMEAFEEFIGPDGSKLGDRAIGKGKMEAHIDALAAAMQADSDTALRGSGYKGAFHLQAHQGEKLTELKGKTANEQGTDAERGAIGSQLPDADLKFRSNETRQLQAENNANTGPTGLAKDDDAKVSKMVSQYTGATDADRAKILTQLTAYVNSPRQGIASGVIGIARDNPELFGKLKQVMPPNVLEQVNQYDAQIPANKRAHVIQGPNGSFVVPHSVVGGK